MNQMPFIIYNVQQTNKHNKDYEKQRTFLQIFILS